MLGGELFAQPFQRRPQAEFVEHRRAQLAGQRARVANGLIHEIQDLAQARLEAAEDRVAGELRQAQLHESQGLSQVVVQVGRDGAPFPFFRKGEFRGEAAQLFAVPIDLGAGAPMLGDLRLQRRVGGLQLRGALRHLALELVVRLQRRLIVELMLQVHAQHFGQRIDEVALFAQERTLGRRRALLQVADLQAPLRRCRRAVHAGGEARALSPWGLPEVRAGVLPAEKPQACAGDLGVLPRSGEEADDLVHEPVDRPLRVLQEAGGAVQRGEFFDALAEAVADGVLGHASVPARGRQIC